MFRLILFRLSESYFRHRWLYLVPILVMLVFAGAYLLLTKPKFLAQGILYVQKDTFLAQLTSVREDTGSIWYTPAQATSNELSSLIQTDAFIRSVINETKLESEMDKGSKNIADTLDSVRKSIWVNTMGDNQVFFGSSYEDPEVAVQLVDGMINSYLRWKTNSERADSEVALNFFTGLIGTYRSALENARSEMRNYLTEHPEPVRGERTALERMEIERLQSEIDLSYSRYSNAIEKEEDARLSIAQIESDAKQTYIVIDSPHLPFKRAVSRRDQMVKVGIFAGVGLLLSLGAIAGSAMFDHTFRVPLDAYQRLGLPVLAVVPDTTMRKEKPTRSARWKKKKDEKEEEEVKLPSYDYVVEVTDTAQEVQPQPEEMTPQAEIPLESSNETSEIILPADGPAEVPGTADEASQKQNGDRSKGRKH